MNSSLVKSGISERCANHQSSLACLIKPTCTTWVLEIIDITDEMNPKAIATMVSQIFKLIFSYRKILNSCLSTATVRINLTL